MSASSMPVHSPRFRWAVVSAFSVVVAIGTMGCGDQIGDSCSLATDCAYDGSRICDTTQTDGYCTIQGCDYNTCPDNSECVSFFTGEFANRPCNPVTEDSPTAPTTNDCAVDELCALDGHCVAALSEVRFCMKTCESNGDCRDGYECRDLTLMVKDGGEPVLAPGLALGTDPQPFCAMAPVAATSS